MRPIVLKVDGATYSEWTSAEVTRDLKDFAGSFSFTLRDYGRSLASFPYASPVNPAFKLKPGMEVEVQVAGKTVLKGYIETVAPSIDEGQAEVTVSGKDKAGDLIDCAAAPEGPSEYVNVKLEDAAKRIAEPYGLTVKSEIDTGAVFPRYGIDLTETGLSAIEKAARQRHALVLSDGVGGLLITRTGARRAPADLILPGNVKASGGSYSHKGRHSKTIVRGQSEKAGTARDGRAAPLSAGGTAARPGERKATDGSATARERRGITATGMADDDEIKRYRPTVHLARSKADEDACKDEADWRSRTARGASEEISYRVHGHTAAGRLWTVNEMVAVSDAFQDIERDMLISRVTFRYDDGGAETEITVTSPEAFDKQPVKGRRNNRKRTAKAGQLDGSASAL